MTNRQVLRERIDEARRGLIGDTAEREEDQERRAREAARSRAYAAAHPEIVRARKRRYYLAHRDEQLARQAAWRERNREHVRARDRAYQARRRESALA